MPLNERKIVRIILQECKNVEERCTGYKEELQEVISDIIAAERQHKVGSRINIQKQINEKCNSTSLFLVEQRKRDMQSREDNL